MREARVEAWLAALRGGGAAADEAALALSDCEAEDLVPPIRSILQGTDPSWKAIVLERVVAKLPVDIGLEWAPELLTLAMNPTESDLEEELDERAEAILSLWL